MLVLSILLLLDKISFQPKPRSVSSLVIPGVNKVIIATLLIHIDTCFADVTFFENSSMFPITHPPNYDVIPLPIFYPIPNTSHVPSTTPPRPLQVYTRRPRTDNQPIDLSINPSIIDYDVFIPSTYQLTFPLFIVTSSLSLTYQSTFL